MPDDWKKRLISIVFTLAVVALIGLIMAPLPFWTPSPTPTPEPTATLEPTPTPSPDLTACTMGCDFTTLQTAIDAAGNGDEIALLDAVHSEQGITVDEDGTIVGQAQLTNSTDAGNNAATTGGGAYKAPVRGA